MKNIKNLAAFYYLGLIIGYQSKVDIISWTDRVIEEGIFPYELVEVSLSGSKSIEDVASLLKKAYGRDGLLEPLYKLIGKLVIELENKQITDDDFFTYIFRLYFQGNAFLMNDKLQQLLDRLSDGYYLATEGIYGDLESIRNEAIQELSMYKEYASLFDDA